ncbi:uroporphyrinogen-III synthase [Candidatus Bathyarchaeota archaeon]|nr:uroporphyrinogen-III synthase [Candidatus Bathyarchaeota archaeon]
MVQAPSLKGKIIAITRALNQAAETVKLIEEKGGKAYLIPTLDFKMPEDLTPVKTLIEDLKAGKADYTVFMSSNAVEYIFKEAETLGLIRELRKGLKETLVIAVGPKTAEKLEAHGVQVNIIPEKYSSEGVAKALEKLGVSGKTIFIPRVRDASPALREKLKALGNIVEEVPVYEQILPSNGNLVKCFAEALASGRIDAIIFGSSQSVRNFKEILEAHLPGDKLKEAIKTTTIVAIGPETAKTLREIGLRADIIPEKYTFEAALEALVQYWSES